MIEFIDQQVICDCVLVHEQFILIFFVRLLDPKHYREERRLTNRIVNIWQSRTFQLKCHQLEHGVFELESCRPHIGIFRGIWSWWLHGTSDFLYFCPPPNFNVFHNTACGVYS